MNVPVTREPRQVSSRWATVRYALGSNARTARFGVIWLVMTGGTSVVLAELLRHIRLCLADWVFRVLIPAYGGTRHRHFAAAR